MLFLIIDGHNDGWRCGQNVSSSLIHRRRLLSAPAAAQAAGLGKLTVLSHPRASRCAPRSTWSRRRERRAGHAQLLRLASPRRLPPVQSSVSLALARVEAGGRAAPERASPISGHQTQPVPEPFVDLLVELTWKGGRILRAYTALLDPPLRAQRQPAAPAAAAAPQPEAGSRRAAAGAAGRDPAGQRNAASRPPEAPP